MDKEFRQKIEPIKMQMQCPDPSSWVNNENEPLCKARDSGLETFIECMAAKRYDMCGFNLPFSSIHLCRCPPRVFLLKKLGK